MSILKGNQLDIKEEVEVQISDNGLPEPESVWEAMQKWMTILAEKGEFASD